MRSNLKTAGRELTFSVCPNGYMSKSNSNSSANQLGKNRNLENSPPHACGSWLPSLFPSRWEGEKEIKNREGFLM
jgi:hypothetical protein